VDSRTGLNGRKISSQPGFDTGPSSLQSVTIPTELPGPQKADILCNNNQKNLVVLNLIKKVFRLRKKVGVFETSCVYSVKCVF